MFVYYPLQFPKKPFQNSDEDHGKVHNSPDTMLAHLGNYTKKDHVPFVEGGGGGGGATFIFRVSGQQFWHVKNVTTVYHLLALFMRCEVVEGLVVWQCQQKINLGMVDNADKYYKKAMEDNVQKNFRMEIFGNV